MTDAQRAQKHTHQLPNARLIKHAAVADQGVEQHQRHKAVLGVGDGAGEQAQHQRLQLSSGDGTVAHVFAQLRFDFGMYIHNVYYT